MTESPALGVPEFERVTHEHLQQALRRGWSDFISKPGFGLFFGAVYVLVGWLMIWVTMVTGQSYWLVFAAIGFPLVGPFAAVGLYEVSHRIDQGLTLSWPVVLGVIWQQRSRQLPWICAVIIIVFLFWFFLAHMIFALFLGLSTMTNVSTSFEIYTTLNGIKMLTVGTLVGAGFALLLFSMTVIALPLLLDREVDFVTAMITSFKMVQENPVVLIGWGMLIALLTFAALIPAFLGLLVILPWLGHASWHLYAILAGSSDATPQDFTKT